MALVGLKLEALDNGRIQAQINEELQKVARHVIAYPLDTRDRIVSVKIRLKPALHEESGVNSPRIRCEVNTTTPARKSLEVVGIVRDGQIQVSQAGNTARDNLVEEMMESGG